VYIRITLEMWKGPQDKDNPVTTKTTAVISENDIAAIADAVNELYGKRVSGPVLTFGYGVTASEGLARGIWALLTTAYRKYQKGIEK
jgi:hypothetical protein